MMSTRMICFYFQVHQPFRLRTYRFFDIGKSHHYYDDFLNRSIMRKVADKCYLPVNQLMLNLITTHKGQFKISYSISGMALEQFQNFAPEVIDSFKKLANTGCVEFLAETYAHSLCALKSKNEFKRQVTQHATLIESLFGQKPVTFRNTELIYSDKISSMVAELGYKGMLTEGAKHILGWKSPNYAYHSAPNPELKLLLRNFRLSDDIAFRFSQRSWSEWPLTTKKFVNWLNAVSEKEEIVNLFMDYETFGEHQWKETGILDFLKELPSQILSASNYVFETPAGALKKLESREPIKVSYPISWADEERDLTAWLGNDLQDDAFDKLYDLEEKILRCNDDSLNEDWNYLQTSDHFYYMCTKFFSDGEVHTYFNPYNTPYDAFINYMNILSDFTIRLNKACSALENEKKKPVIPKKLSSKKLKNRHQ